jgi:hypothetical protein
MCPPIFTISDQKDIVVANKDSNDISVFLGYGNGSFTYQTTFSAGGRPRGVTFGDFNNDGRQDLAIANYGNASVSILLNTCD